MGPRGDVLCKELDVVFAWLSGGSCHLPDPARLLTGASASYISRGLKEDHAET